MYLLAPFWRFSSIFCIFVSINFFNLFFRSIPRRVRLAYFFENCYYYLRIINSSGIFPAFRWFTVMRMSESPRNPPQRLPSEKEYRQPLMWAVPPMKQPSQSISIDNSRSSEFAFYLLIFLSLYPFLSLFSLSFSFFFSFSNCVFRRKWSVWMKREKESGSHGLQVSRASTMVTLPGLIYSFIHLLFIHSYCVGREINGRRRSLCLLQISISR